MKTYCRYLRLEDVRIQHAHFNHSVWNSVGAICYNYKCVHLQRWLQLKWELLVSRYGSMTVQSLQIILLEVDSGFSWYEHDYFRTKRYYSRWKLTVASSKNNNIFCKTLFLKYSFELSCFRLVALISAEATDNFHIIIIYCYNVQGKGEHIIL